MSNPNRRRRPVWCGDVDTTRPGATWDVQDDGCCGPCKPPVPGCGPVRPPMPQFPDCGYHIPPVQYVPGMNEQEQLENLNCKMNELIELFNCNTDKVFGAYEEVVRSAVCNDAFYKEITVESGYLADASTSYELVHIPFVDCAGQPIYMEMGLAYNNTTNSGVTESVFDKALEVYADKILPAAERGFQGVAIWKGAPIYSGETHGDTRALIPGQCDYTLGVTENGYFKIYDTPNDRDNTGMIKAMRQDKVRNSMGCAVIIRGGEYVVDDNLSDMELPCTVMAMNYKTKERFILAIGKDNVASTITPEMIANLLKKYDVDVAALTSWGQQSYLLDKGQFSFMPTSTDSDGIPTVPQSAAFWYITKRRNFHNDYVKEVAALTIQMGENLWYDELTSEAVDNLKLDFVDLRNDLEQEIQDRKDADDALGERIDKEIANREAADTALDEKYAAEVTRLDGEIEALSQRVTTEVTRLDALIQSTKEALTAKDVKEVKLTHDGTRDTYQVVLNDGTVLGADVIVYNYDQLVQKLDSYATVEQRLDAEIQARKDADDALNALITAEQQARANGDTALGEQIASVRTELTELIHGNTTDITALQGALATLTQTVQSNYTSLNERVTSNAENIANLQGSYGALQATVAALNETVTGLQQSFASTEQSFENVKQTVANMQTELNAFEERIEGELGNYLPLSGGTMAGNLNFNETSSIVFDNPKVSTPNSIQGVSLVTFKETTGGTRQTLRFTDNTFMFYGESQNDLALLGAGGIFFTNDTNPGNRISIAPSSHDALIFIGKGGDINLTGILQPKWDNDVANKKYVDTVGENLAGEIAEVGGQFENYLPLRGGVLTGTLGMRGDIMMQLHSSIKFNAENGVGAVIAWDNTGSRLAVNNGPLYIQQNLQFVGLDQVFQIGSINSLSETPNIAGVGIYHGTNLAEFYVGTPSHDYAAANKKYVDTVGENLAGEIAQVGGQFDNYLPLSGGTVTGTVLFNADINFKSMRNIWFKSSEGEDMARFAYSGIHDAIGIYGHRSDGSAGGSLYVSGDIIQASRGTLFRIGDIYGVSETPETTGIGIFNTNGLVQFFVDKPTHDYAAANKAYVDAADEGFLYVDRGRLYAHGDTPQDVLLDRLDFAPGGVESGGIVSLDCGAGSAGPILSVSDGDSGLALLQAKTSDFSSNDDVMTLGAVAKLGNDDYPYTEPMLATYKVTSGGIITGAYLLRSPQGLWAINISGSQEESFGHNEARLIGDTVDITVAVDDATSMTITFSQAVNAVSISKVIGIAPLTLEGVS